MAGGAGTELSRGGMVTKIEAGKIALASGTHMVITSGKVEHPLRRSRKARACTWLLAPSDPVTARKRWIAGQLEPKGGRRSMPGPRRRCCRARACCRPA